MNKQAQNTKAAYISEKNEKGGGRLKRQAPAPTKVTAASTSALVTRQFRGYLWPIHVYRREKKVKPPPKDCTKIEHCGESVTGVLMKMFVDGAIEVWQEGQSITSKIAELASSENQDLEEIEGAEARAQKRMRVKQVENTETDSSKLKFQFGKKSKAKMFDDEDDETIHDMIFGNRIACKKQKNDESDSENGDDDLDIEAPAAAGDGEVGEEKTKKPKTPRKKSGKAAASTDVVPSSEAAQAPAGPKKKIGKAAASANVVSSAEAAQAPVGPEDAEVVWFSFIEFVKIY